MKLYTIKAFGVYDIAHSARQRHMPRSHLRNIRVYYYIIFGESCNDISELSENIVRYTRSMCQLMRNYFLIDELPYNILKIMLQLHTTHVLVFDPA